MSNQHPLPDYAVNRRIQELITHLRKKPSAFAESIDRTPQTLASILKDRNKPGYDLLEAILLAYPSVNANWLMRGKGPMMLNEPLLPEPPPDKYVWSLEQRVEEQAATIRVLLGKFKAGISSQKARPFFRVLSANLGARVFTAG